LSLNRFKTSAATSLGDFWGDIFFKPLLKIIKEETIYSAFHTTNEMRFKCGLYIST